MKIIGLIGGIASGKSSVAAELARLGAVVLDADEAAHRVINDAEVKRALVERWGESVLRSSGDVDRAAVGRLVFAEDPQGRENLHFLEQTLHPRVREEFTAKLSRLAAEGASAAVIDAPLLLEAGWEDLCDSIVFVDSSRAYRVDRVRSRNWTAAEMSRREAAQMPIEEKRQRATHVIRNDRSAADLTEAVGQFWVDAGLA